MTGYAQHQFSVDDVNFLLEIKTVNHRYLDIHFKLPDEIKFIENKLKKQVRQYVSRGRVELSLVYHRPVEDSKTVSLNWKFFDKILYDISQKLESDPSKINQEALMLELLTYDEFLIVRDFEIDWDEKEHIIIDNFNELLRNLQNSRAIEGEYLATVLEQSLREIENTTTEIFQLHDNIEKDYYHRLKEKIQQYCGDELDNSRILTEVALIIEKGDITEELIRIQSHCKQLHTLFSTNKPIGKEVDFLVQELNREVNTMGSKTKDIKIKELVIQMKTELEKIREQIQNIE